MKTTRCNRIDDLRKELSRISTTIRRVGIRKKGSNVIHAGSAKHCINDGMDEDITVRMCNTTFWRGNRNASNDKVPALFEPMEIPSSSNPNVSSHTSHTPPSKSFLYVIFVFFGLPVTAATRPPNSMKIWVSSVKTEPTPSTRSRALTCAS